MTSNMSWLRLDVKTTLVRHMLNIAISLAGTILRLDMIDIF